jgi:hypothetical protein
MEEFIVFVKEKMEEFIGIHCNTNNACPSTKTLSENRPV